MQAPLYSIIVPTYNERGNIAIFVQLLWQHLQHEGPFEVIVVDDNSPDNTQEVVRQLQAKAHPARVKLVTRPKKLGLGSAYMEGLQHAQGEFIILMDADFSHHPKYLKGFMQKQRQTQADIVSGTRYAAGGGVAGWGLVRKLTSRGANLLASFVLGAKATDLTGAFRLYRKRCLLEVLQKTTSKGYAFQMEVIVRAQYAGMHIEEVSFVCGMHVRCQGKSAGGLLGTPATSSCGLGR